MVSKQWYTKTDSYQEKGHWQHMKRFDLQVLKVTKHTSMQEILCNT